MLYIPIPPVRAFHAPILKVPFLLANGVASYRALTPPDEPPLAKEREKAQSAPGILVRYPALNKVIKVCAKGSKVRFDSECPTLRHGLTANIFSFETLVFLHRHLLH